MEDYHRNDEMLDVDYDIIYILIDNGANWNYKDKHDRDFLDYLYYSKLKTPIIEKYGDETFAIDPSRSENKETINDIKKSLIEKIGL